MGYGRALLQRDVRREEESFQKKAKKKSLWGSIGRTAGGLLAMGLTGGIANPLTVGLITGGATLLGGAAGAKASGGKLTGGRFFKADRRAAQKELGAFGSRNITESLTSGITAGIGQKLKLMKSKQSAAKLSDPGFGMDFKGSTIGKGLAKGAAKRKAAEELANMRGFQGQYESLEAAKKSKKLATMRGWEGQFEDVGEGADVVMDQGFIGPTEASTPFDRSSMIKRQDAARYRANLDSSKWGTGTSGSGTDFSGPSSESFSPQYKGKLWEDSAFSNVGKSIFPSYDLGAESIKKSKEMSDMIKWQDKLF